MRTYRIYVPDQLDPTVDPPLVLNLHGLGSNGFEQEIYANFGPIADTAGFIVVSPDGLNDAWNIGIVPNGPDDVGFMSALIDSMRSQYQIDLRRVYATGMSNGGFLCYLLACELEDRIAAIASVTGSMIIPSMSSCQAERPVPILEIHGTADPTVPYNGTFGIAPIPMVIDFWLARNGCDTLVADTLDYPDLTTADSSTVRRFQYTNCSAQTEVIHYRIDGGGHSWPGAIPIPGLNPTNQDIRASLEIWHFFNRHQHPNPSPATGLERLFDPGVTVFPNPARERVQVRWNHPAIQQLQVFDLQGKPVWAQGLRPGTDQQEIDTQQWPAGIYFLRLQSVRGAVTEKLLIEPK